LFLFSGKKLKKCNHTPQQKITVEANVSSQVKTRFGIITPTRNTLQNGISLILIGNVLKQKTTHEGGENIARDKAKDGSFRI
jgi:hypothetical protein